MDDSYSKLIVRKDGSLLVGLDHDRFIEEFGDSLSVSAVNELKLIQFEQEAVLYSPDSTYIDLITLVDRMQLMESFELTSEEETYQNEVNLYYSYRMLLGYGEPSMEWEEGVLNEDALEAMRVVVKEKPGTEYAKNVQAILDSLEEEGRYGDETNALAEAIIAERFDSLFEDMSEEMAGAMEGMVGE